MQWKKLLFGLVAFGGLFSVGCGAKDVQTTDYLRCNDTSVDDMAEIESGFFYVHEQILYYADKTDMTKWVPVCNKADCLHKRLTSCNAYIGTEIAQKGEKLYYVYSEPYAIGLNAKYRVFVNEVSIDGSPSKKVYQIPFEEDPRIYRALISSQSLIISYDFLTEDGMYQYNIDRLNADGTLHNLYAGQKDSDLSSGLVLSSSVAFVKGDEGIISSELALAYTDKTGIDVQRVLWRVDGEEPERVPVPEDLSWGNFYLAEDYMIKYERRDGYEKGYYKYDFNTGERTLLGKAKEDNANGYIMTEDCVVECNRYLNQVPENPYLRIYYDGTWREVKLPEIVTKASADTSFLPESIASDRIFFLQEGKGDEGYSCRLYYVMLDDKTPELIYCTTFGSESYFELSKEPEQSEEDYDTAWKELDVSVFDTEEYVIKVTGAGKEDADYKITMYCENKTDDKEYHFVLQDAAVNGMQVFVGAGVRIKPKECKEHIVYITKSSAKHVGISDIYDMDSYTDVSFLIYDSDNKDNKKIVHIYPQGEEMATSYVREQQPTDEILIDNAYVTATIVGYEGKAYKNDTVRLFVENKTDQTIVLKREGFPKANGIQLKQYKQENGANLMLVSEWDETVVFPNCCSYYTITVPAGLLEENKISSIENYDMELHLFYEADRENILLQDTVVITPQS